MTDPDPSSTDDKPPSMVAQLPYAAEQTQIAGDHPPTRIHESWFERLRQGFRGRAGTLRDDLEDVLSQDEDGNREAEFRPQERLLLRNALRLRELRTEHVMMPRADIDAVEQDLTLAELMRMFYQSGHSRMPVHAGTLDDAVGMVHIKDLIAYFVEKAEVAADPEHNDEMPQTSNLDMKQIMLGTTLKDSGLVREILFVPLSMPAMDLMTKMQAARIQMALVIDEYGGADGLVCLEDIVETVVGDIEDEHDDGEEAKIKLVTQGVWIADARTDLESFIAETGAAFDLEKLSEDVDTLGGLLFTLIGRVPVRGELLHSPDLPGYEFEILDADPRRIKRLRIRQHRNG